MEETARLVECVVKEQYEASASQPAFETLVRDHQDMAYGYAYARVLDPYEAQDIVQDSLITVYRKLQTLRNPDAFAPWLRRIVYHECLRHRKSEARDIASSELDAVPSHHDDPETEYLRHETRAEVQRAIGGLTAANRVPIVLYYFNGYSQQQIAELTGLEVATVKKRIQRGREQLKQEMIEMIREDMSLGVPSEHPGVLRRVSLAASFERAAKLGQLSLVEAMLVDGIDINEQDSKGRSLLHWAAEHGHQDAVELLLRCGADRRLKDRNGRTPSECAVRHGFRTIARIIDGTLTTDEG